ncbi:Ig-like domain-containing protein, partial [Klebsiella aerogenes]
AVSAIVTDANGNPVSGQEVTFSAAEGATVTPAKATTGSDGKASASVTSQKAGTYAVTAEVNGKGTTKNTAFIADESTAGIAELNISHDNSAASGKVTDGVAATAVVADESGNPVSGQWVTFTVTEGANITTLKGITGTEGRAAAVVTTKAAGTYKVTAEVNGSKKDADVHFTADGSTAVITEDNLSVATGAVADGKTSNAVSAIVT